MKVALYARVSKEGELSDGSFQEPENQLVPMRKFCEAMNWEVKAEWVDRVSGGTSDRPQFQAMLAEVRQRHYDLIMVWSLDRFSREGIQSTLAYIKQLKAYRTAIKSMQESWLDTSQENVAELLLAIVSWVAAEERRKISQRTKAGIQRLKNIGKWKGGRPRKKIRAEDKPLIDKYLEKGKNITYISRKVGIAKQTIQEYSEKGGATSLEQKKEC